jgi:SAM-dependent methyltransferase/GNAT superfamily N-acetyltransferase
MEQQEFLPAQQRLARAGSFAAVAGQYERGRPSYPPQAVEWLLGTQALEVLDLGAGTGKLTEALLERGHSVTAVEPLAEMRAILQARLPRARVIAGAAEQLPLQDRAVDAVVVGAAFHWFEQERALAEIARVLRGSGVLGLLGNTFDVSVPWVAALREILGPPAIQRPGHWPSRELLHELFADVADGQFPHSQRVGLATLRDLACSRSNVAIMLEQERAQLLGRIDRLWEQSAELRACELATLPWIARVRRCRGLRASGTPGWQATVVRAAQVRALRGEVLRAGQPADATVFAGDDEPDTLHLAVFDGGGIVGVASVLREAFPPRPSASAWRIRGMASTPQTRGRGIGTALLARCERHAREHAAALLWCTARVRARSLYERGGMTVLGEPFDIPPIGEHYLMFKELTSL